MTDKQIETANARFREHVTSTAFNLSLSKNMIAMLAMVANENNPSDNLEEAKSSDVDEYSRKRK